jgi:hypothetical protein
MRPTSLVLAALLLALAVFLVTGRSEPRLVMTSGAGMAIVSDEPYGTFHLDSICLSHSGTAHILNVEPVKSAGGIKVTDFSTYPLGQLHGRVAADSERLRSLPQFKGTHKVTATCRDKASNHPQLAVEIHNPGSHNAIGRGLRITYEIGGRVQAVEADFDLGLCASDRGCLDP